MIIICFLFLFSGIAKTYFSDCAEAIHMMCKTLSHFAYTLSIRYGIACFSIKNPTICESSSGKMATFVFPQQDYET